MLLYSIVYVVLLVGLLIAVSHIAMRFLTKDTDTVSDNKEGSFLFVATCALFGWICFDLIAKQLAIDVASIPWLRRVCKVLSALTFLYVPIVLVTAISKYQAKIGITILTLLILAYLLFGDTDFMQTIGQHFVEAVFK